MVCVFEIRKSHPAHGYTDASTCREDEKVDTLTQRTWIRRTGICDLLKNNADVKAHT